jgi:eukaryotic-like serine/threonine-protein kinase
MQCPNCHTDGIAPETQICPQCGVLLPSLTQPVPTKPQLAKKFNRRTVLLGGLGMAGFGDAVYWAVASHPRLIGKPLPAAPFAKPSSFNFEVVTIGKTGQIMEREQKSALYFTEDLGGGVTLEMVEIPAGKFMMGSVREELKPDELPEHRVVVPRFYLGRFTVTQAQWQVVMGSNPAEFKGQNHPVELVSWNDAQAFCKKLSQKTGRTYRLPSEAEWEYACRANTVTPMHFGPTLTTDLANYHGDVTRGSNTYNSGPTGQSRDQTTPVGSFPANAFGLHDMHGNVWEWCEDKYHKSYSGAPTDGSTWLTGGENNRVFRGGGWSADPGECRSAARNRDSASLKRNFVGFRVVSVAL